MRWFYIAIFVLFVTATVIFAAQNFQVVSVAFLGANIQMPLAFLIGIIYMLGAVTGGSLLAVLRRSYEATRGRTTVPS
jgi:putative membrane protein